MGRTPLRLKHPFGHEPGAYGGVVGLEIVGTTACGDVAPTLGLFICGCLGAGRLKALGLKLFCPLCRLGGFGLFLTLAGLTVALGQSPSLIARTL
jgi:hypothetical protein